MGKTRHAIDEGQRKRKIKCESYHRRMSINRLPSPPPPPRAFKNITKKKRKKLKSVEANRKTWKVSRVNGRANER